MAFSFLEYRFFVLETFTFLYYANAKSDDVIGGSTKTAHQSIENNSGPIKAVFFDLGTNNVHHKRNILEPIVSLPCQQLCRWFCFDYDQNFQILSYCGSKYELK